MAARKTRLDPLRDILQGVDMVGTMIHTDLPRVMEELEYIREKVDALAQIAHAEDAAPTDGPVRTVRSVRPNIPPPPDEADTGALLVEIRELLENQDRRMSALEQRIARLVEAVSQART